jgi:plastocyanin
MARKKRIRLAAVAFAAIAAVVTGSAAAAPTHGATVSIRHQTRGCHSWSFNGGAFRPSLAVRINRGATITIVNNDVMPHKLVQTSGPSAKLLRPAMNHMAAKAQVRFTRAGVYKFTTKAGEDYAWASNMKTIGEDNVLRLTVRVS